MNHLRGRSVSGTVRAAGFCTRPHTTTVINVKNVGATGGGVPFDLKEIQLEVVLKVIWVRDGPFATSICRLICCLDQHTVSRWFSSASLRQRWRFDDMITACEN